MNHRFPRIEPEAPGVIEALRRMSEVERFKQAMALNRSVRRIARAGIIHQHPEWNQEQVDAELTRRIQGGS
jgi:pterin-4a-carbinolamine dehydratase